MGVREGVDGQRPYYGHRMGERLVAILGESKSFSSFTALNKP